MRFDLPLAGTGPPARLAVRLDEPAPPGRLAVLYLHGFGSSQEGEKAELFRARFLARGVAFCSFDFRGHGASGGDMLGLTLTRNLEDLAAVRGELAARGYADLILLGSSMGGLTGLWHAARHPEGIAAAVHLAPALGLEETFTARLGGDEVARWEREGKLAIGHDLGSWDVGWGFVADLRAHDPAALAADYRTPTLLFQGKHDDSVPWRRVVEFATAAAGEEVELHLFADGDHRMLGRLPRLWRMSEEFLAARGVLPAL